MQNMQNIQGGAKTTLLKFLIMGACMDPFCTTPQYGRRELRDHLRGNCSGYYNSLLS